MNERIKQLRKALQLSQEAFAGRMKLTRNYIYMLESGNCEISDKLIWQICKEYGVNENWLRTGEGEMFQPKDRETEIAELVAKIYKEDDPFRRSMIRLLTDMSEDQIKLLKEMAVELVKEMQKENLSE